MEVKSRENIHKECNDKTKLLMDEATKCKEESKGVMTNNKWTLKK
jgi:hypothetical protein